MIDEAKLEAAMDYLANTDEDCAELKAGVARSEYMAKVAESLAYISSAGVDVIDGTMRTKNIEQRKAEAKTSQPVQAKWAEHFDAVKAYELVRARRERAMLVVDVYRTQAANRRMGQ